MTTTYLGECRDKCGDGMKYFNSLCDDGNTLNNDGCTSNCLIEKDHFCRGGL